MAIVNKTTNPSSSSPSFLLESSLYCEEEERWDDDNYEEEVVQEEEQACELLSPFMLLEHDLFWEDEELISLFCKETEQQADFENLKSSACNDNGLIGIARAEAVDWLLRVVSHYGFTTLTGVLAINYLDRLLLSLHFQSDKPWMFQLLAVTCLSLAAKVEETQVPLLLDLQVEDTKYIFEAKAIQRMELLVLSTLKWKMHLVTPLSFLDHIIRRLGLKTNVHWEFLRRCERLVLSLVSDSRFVSYQPSVLATATMMHIIDQVEPQHSIDYKNQLLGVINISKEKVNECYNHITDLSTSSTCVKANKKRKMEAVIDSVVVLSSEESGEGVLLKKKSRGQTQNQKPLALRVPVGSPS